jgi:hypothetical protein
MNDRDYQGLLEPRFSSYRARLTDSLVKGTKVSIPVSFSLILTIVTSHRHALSHMITQPIRPWCLLLSKFEDNGI